MIRMHKSFGNFWKKSLNGHHLLSQSMTETAKMFHSCNCRGWVLEESRLEFINTFYKARQIHELSWLTFGWGTLLFLPSAKRNAKRLTIWTKKWSMIRFQRDRSKSKVRVTCFEKVRRSSLFSSKGSFWANYFKFYWYSVSTWYNKFRLIFYSK